MLLGQGYLQTTDVINGQMLPVTPAFAINPTAFGPGPISYDTYAATPNLPPYSGVSSVGGVSGATGSDVANTTAAAAAGSNPFNLKLSPLVWSLLFLIVGIAGLRFVHWR